jgi:hypothetical protein
MSYRSNKTGTSMDKRYKETFVLPKICGLEFELKMPVFTPKSAQFSQSILYI